MKPIIEALTAEIAKRKLKEDELGIIHNFMVKNNDVNLIISQCLKSAKDSNFEIYYQPNSEFYFKLEVDEYSTYEMYKEQFTDYCNYFDKHRIPLIRKIYKKIINYTKNQIDNPEFHKDYPSDKKMILVVENFNFWDLQSQYFFVNVAEKYSNIILVGQFRTDFDFASNHLDIGIKSGKGNFIWFDE